MGFSKRATPLTGEVCLLILLVLFELPLSLTKRGIRTA